MKILDELTLSQALSNTARAIDLHIVYFFSGN